MCISGMKWVTHHFFFTATTLYMFIGEYRHTFDAKNRISLPAKFRKELGGSVIVTRGLDHCLFVYPKSAWKKETAKLAGYSMGNAAERGLSRFMLTGANEVELDSAGRVLVPDYLKSFGKLTVKSVIAGVNEHIEIWDEAAWDAYTKEIEGKADELAESLS